MKTVIATCTIEAKNGDLHTFELSQDTDTKLYMVTKNGVIVDMRHEDVNEAQHAFGTEVMSVNLN